MSFALLSRVYYCVSNHSTLSLNVENKPSVAHIKEKWISA